MNNQAKINTPLETSIGYYMEEGSGIFACALAKFFTGGKIYVLSNIYGEDWSDDIPYELTHVYFSLDRKVCIDAKGCRSEIKMAKDFSLSAGNYRIIGGFEPNDFRKNFMGTSKKFPLYGKIADIEKAEELIKKYPHFYFSSFI